MKRLALLLATIMLLGLAGTQRAVAEDPRFSIGCNSLLNSHLSPLLTTGGPTLLPPDGVWFSPQVFRLSGEARFVATISASQSFGPAREIGTIIFDPSSPPTQEQPVLLTPVTGALPNQETITITIDETRNPPASHPDFPVVCTYTVLGDSDNDGIPGLWEQNGVTRNGQFINLPAMGANPNRADIFLHIDWMQNATIDQRLSNAALQQVVTAFANAPTSNPDGSTGISMHIDQGPASTLNFTTGATWGALSRAQSIPWQANLGTASGNNYNWTAFQNIKTANFEPTGRAPIFHYVIAASRQEPGQNSSGISRNGSNLAAGASDFLVTLGGFQNGVGSQQQQAGTLMHELGHNLGLYHGGSENTNFKPNYLSIMSYSFQMGGLTVGGTAGVVDYSRSALPTLNEGALNEGTGLGPAAGNIGTAHLCGLSSASPRPIRYVNNANGPIDWNCNNSATNGVVSFDANGSGGIDSGLTGWDDWANIKLRVGAIGALGDVALPMISPSEPLVTTDTTPPTTTAQVVPAPTVHGWNKSAVSVTLTANDPGGSVSRLTYRASGVHTIPTTTVLGGVASFNLSNEGITTITFSAQDHQGNVEPEKQIQVRIDLTLPTITLGTAFPPPNAAGWNNTNVSVPFTATDALSGIDTTVPPSSPLVLTAEGTAVTGIVTATDRAGNVTSVTTPAFKIDKTPPVITITAPTEGQVFDSDGTLTPVFGATDALSGVKSVVGQLDTGQVVTSGVTIPLGLLVGQRTLTVTATDVADNVATKEVKFRVRPVFVGVVYNDPNATGAREPGEAGISGVRVFLDNDGDGQFDGGEPSNVTGANGAYRVVG